ncbi:hypothetical protein H6P81_016445 [Aristolochia fimbriata]|uniref:Aminotransferase-like plant mobile domain-containing protein n=1 Tax=Aristolochia fimbriata TaxID=158543 RepID=A0AAV7EAE5_ARIFI|nr:hypothetical protein H6P81_016445 [Aristolochia fimbriata]
MMQYGNPAGSISFDEIRARELFWHNGVKVWYFTPFLVPGTLLDSVDQEASPKEYEHFLCIRSYYLTYRTDNLLAVEPYCPHRFDRQFGFYQDLSGILISDRRVANSIAELLEFWRTSVVRPRGSVEVPCCHGVGDDPGVTLAFRTSWIHKEVPFFKRTWQRLVQAAALAIVARQAPPALPPAEANHLTCSLPSQADCAAIVPLGVAPCTSCPPLPISTPPLLLPCPSQHVRSQLGPSTEDNGDLSVLATLTQPADVVPPGGDNFVIIVVGELPCLVGGSSVTVVGEQSPPTPASEIQGDCGEETVWGGEPPVIVAGSDQVLSQEPPLKLSAKSQLRLRRYALAQWADFLTDDFMPAADSDMPVVIKDAQFFLGTLRETGFDTSLLEQWLINVQSGVTRLEELCTSLKGALSLGDKLAAETKLAKSMQLAKSQRDRHIVDFDMDQADCMATKRRRGFLRGLPVAHCKSLELKVATAKKKLDADKEEVAELELRLTRLCERLLLHKEKE